MALAHQTMTGGDDESETEPLAQCVQRTGGVVLPGRCGRLFRAHRLAPAENGHCHHRQYDDMAVLARTQANRNVRQKRLRLRSDVPCSEILAAGEPAASFFHRAQKLRSDLFGLYCNPNEADKDEVQGNPDRGYFFELFNPREVAGFS